MNQLPAIRESKAVGSGRSAMLVPAIVAAASDQSARRFLEFFAATIRNKNTRQAYYHAVVQFFAWCGSVCMRKAASGMKCRRITIWKPISTPI
jgi:hypothetical protein